MRLCSTQAAAVTVDGQIPCTDTHTDSVCVILKSEYPWLLRWSGTPSGKASNHYFIPLLYPDFKASRPRQEVLRCVWQRVHLTYSTVLSVVCGSSWLFGTLRISRCSGPLRAGIETERWRVDGQKENRGRKSEVRQKSAHCVDCYCYLLPKEMTEGRGS